MMKGERNVAGVRCSEVLAELSEFLDGSLAPSRTQQLREHVDGCDICERFGADFAVAIGALRSLGDADDIDDGVATRLANALADL